jgi:anti-sigma factor RsiW
MQHPLDQVIAGLRCAEVLERLPLYLEGTLAPASRIALEEHVRQCRNCAAFGSAYREVVDQLHTLLNEPSAPDPSAEARLQQRLAGLLDGESLT